MAIQGQTAYLTGVETGNAWASGFSSGTGGPLLPNLEVVDRLLIPLGTQPGKYVLQWRWDCEPRLRLLTLSALSALSLRSLCSQSCRPTLHSVAGEESDQIWASCSDVTIIA